MVFTWNKTSSDLLEESSCDEEVHSPYSHGFEKIYAIETLDISTVRPLAQSAPPPVKSAATSRATRRPSYYLDFGSCWSWELLPLPLYAPLQVLGLTAPCARMLEGAHKRRVGDLFDLKTETVVTVPGLGQGHLDEIARKVTDYLRGYDLSGQIFHLKSLLASLLSDVEIKGVHLLASRYGLEALFPLPPSERGSFLRLTEGEKGKLLLAAKEAALAERKVAFVKEVFANLGAVIFAPWMRRREGLMRLWELEELLQAVCDEPSLSAPTLALLGELYGKPILSQALCQPARGIFAADLHLAALYARVVATAKSFFYSDGVHYPVRTLVRYICQEHSQKWQYLAPEFVARALRLCPELICFKSKDEIFVRLY